MLDPSPPTEPLPDPADLLREIYAMRQKVEMISRELVRQDARGLRDRTHLAIARATGLGADTDSIADPD